MGAYDPNPRKDDLPATPPAPRAPPSADPGDTNLSHGPGLQNFVDRFDALAVRDDPPNDNLFHFHVIKAVEDAESTIRQQLEENNQLKEELIRKTQELQRVRLEAAGQRSTPAETGLTEPDRARSTENGLGLGLQRSLVIRPNGMSYTDDPGPHVSRINGNSKRLSGEQAATDSGGPSRMSTPSSRSLSPTRHRKDGDNDPRYNSSGQGLMPVSETNSNLLWKQDLIVKVREHEEEIAQLRKHLADYSMKEAQVLNEKYVLEKRIAYMRVAFDQQQQDLVDAASKALTYRQDIIEENVRLTYALQAAQQERSTFVSSILPLLSEYSLQPSVLDAQSIVSNLKVLFRHLQEKLIITEEKLKESQYQITPFHVDYPNSNNNNNNSGLPSQSPSHAKALVSSNTTNNLEIVPQQVYTQVRSPMSSPIVQIRSDWDLLGGKASRQVGPTGPSARPEHDSFNRNQIVQQETQPRPVQSDPHVRFNLDSRERNPSFKDLVKDGAGDMEDADMAPGGTHYGRDLPAQWGPASSSPNHTTTAVLDEPMNPAYTYLPTVLEEPSSSFSEAAEEDQLPAIEGLRISGEAFPGRLLQASGYSINGTTSCNFEWVRYMEDGSVHYIDGAKQPDYLVTADDVDAYLAIEVQPLDDRKRKGELVKVFANEQRKITCDPDTQEQIRNTRAVGHVSFEVELSARFLDIWEPAALAIKREGYSIKCSGPRGVVVTEKFQQATSITIPYGHPDEFIIQSADGDGVDYVLKSVENGMPRDTIVLTLRLFKLMAVEKRKGRKRGLFFK